MDPVTVTTTIITLGAFIKDLIDQSEGIRSSIEKVSENRRQIRELAQDIVRTLYDLASLTRGKEWAFRGPELLEALESLKSEMLYVHSKCLKISPIQLPGFRGIPSHLKAWRKRDDLEKKIARLRERANQCLLQFTAFSTARTERVAAGIARTTLRIEQTLIVDNVENQVKARRLEGLMARILLEAEFGQHKLRETVENISADSSFQSLEYQYMSAQLHSLINSVKPLLVCGDLSLVESWEYDTLSFVLVEPSEATPSHALSHILGIVVAIHSRDHASLLDLLMKAMNNLPMCFTFAGLHSEEIVWGHFEIDILRYMAKRGCNVGALPRIADVLGDISRAHCRQFELDVAVDFSQQSLALWVEVSHLSPEADNRIGYLRAMVIHAKNLLAKEDKTAMLCAAQDAISLARPMAKALAESIVSRGTPLTDCERRNADIFCEASFVLAKVLSCLDHPLDSYETFLEAFRTACSLPICGYDPDYWGQYIDSFLDVICKVAEDGRLSLSMLSDCVDLFRKLACIYPKQYSSGFLRVLHAFAYHSQQQPPHSYHSTEQLRLFLEPTHDAAPPALDIAASIPIDSSVLVDAVRLFFAEARAQEHCTVPLIQNIIVAHFPQAIEVLRVVVQSPVFDSLVLFRLLYITCPVIPHLLPAEHIMPVLVDAVKGTSTQVVHATLNFEKWEISFAEYFRHVCQHAARLGVVDEGISLFQELVAYLELQSDAHPRAVIWLRVFLALWVILLCDTARFSDAVDLVKRKRSRILESGDLVPNSWYLILWMLKARILQRVGRHKEALQLLRTGVAEGIRKFWIKGRPFNLDLYFLLPQLASAWGQIGEHAKALEHAEKAATACRDVDTEDEAEEAVLCVQIHSLTIHSNCLAAVGRIYEGLDSAQKAVSLYTEYWEPMWNYLYFPFRVQEVGGAAFFALSLRLLAVDDKEEALLNSQRATILYFELVALAPRHRPTLARSLRHLASILWLLGHQDLAISACVDAVDILRKVVDRETYFLPFFADALDELARYLTESGDNSGASTANVEAAEARLRFASLPSEPEWLFERLEAEDGEDADWWEWGLEQYYDALEGSASEDSAEVNDSADAGDPDFELEDALVTTGIVAEEAEQTVVAEAPESNTSLIFVAPGDSADKPGFKEANDMDNHRIANTGEAAKGTKIQGTLTNILSKPVEIRLSMRSTLMDFIWWTLLLLLASLLAVMYARIV
ncbi:Tetratricopeptide repeat family [Favolaschia claudopus]|uniref:Tetratricopeptide repeat family n=1 Tax=Favolaschia claudopus TaxID=2862362 RepID=A0AAW0AB36_9AGAR